MMANCLRQTAKDSFTSIEDWGMQNAYSSDDECAKLPDARELKNVCWKI
jgi:hypothetical protein